MVSIPVFQNSIVATPVLRTYSNYTGAGCLLPYGSFNFGTTANTTQNTVRSQGTDLSSAAAQNPALATVLNLTDSQKSVALATTNALTTPYTVSGSIDPSRLDVARASIEALGSADGFDSSYILDNLALSILSASTATNTSARDQVYAGNAVSGVPNTWNSNNSEGIGLSVQAYGVMNAQRSACSQIGFNSAVTNG